MPFDVAKQEQTFFSLWAQDAQNAYESLLTDLNAEIVRMRSFGMSDANIYERLTQNLTDHTGIFSSFDGWIEGGVDKLMGSVGQVESNANMTAEAYVWELDPSAEHCDDCINNSQMDAQSFADWEALGLPGAGNTECNGYCKCSLRAS